MIRGIQEVRGGYDVKADAVVVGSGAGGAVAALNLAEAGLKVVVIEAGPQVKPSDMTRDAPRFMARFMMDGGLRVVAGNSSIPAMAGRCLGGGTVMNSAIMLPTPTWLRRLWHRQTGVDLFTDDEMLDAVYARVFKRTRTTPTPMTVLGKRNLAVMKALEKAGIPGKPLPRAVHNCEGCADCMTGCFEGRKQSTDRSYLPDTMRLGAEVYTCSEVRRVRMSGGRAVGVEGVVIDPNTWRKAGRFRVDAPIVVLAAGVMATPVILLDSGINPNKAVGADLIAHITGGCIGIMHEQMDPWVGASQGWGAFSPTIQGLKYECLWAPPSVLAVRWGGIGRPFLERLPEVKHGTIIAAVYRGDCSGWVKSGFDGRPRLRLYVPKHSAQTVMRGVKVAADALLDSGARVVQPGIPGLPEQMSTKEETEMLLSSKINARHLSMTANHMFSSCKMNAHPRRGVVDADGRVKGVDNLYVCDTSIFPSGSAVNPQATVMALSDIISGRIAARA